VNLLEARTKLAAILAPVLDSDPDVLTSLVDAIEPPALMLGWGEPWLQPSKTLCGYEGRIIVTAVASRIMPGEGLGSLEALVAYVKTRIEANPTEWTFESVTGPRVFLIAKTSYLACRLTYVIVVDDG
jgi:hypothetical protein